MRPLSALVLTAALVLPATAFAANTVVINEVAWMGTTYGADAEWIELHNATGAPVSLTGWTLKAKDGTPSINLAGSIPAGGTFLLERTSDNSVRGVAADQVYTGALGNTKEQLLLRNASGTLVDQVSSWYAGNNTTKATMSRIDPAGSGTDRANWETSTATYDGGKGSPRGRNRPGGTSSSWYSVYFTDHLNTVMPDYGPKAMANALIAAINGATTSIDFAVYGFNGSEEIVQALFAAQARGVTVRGVVDSYASGFHPYRGTEQVINTLGTVVQDDDDRIMHNKFFVFDQSRVWTGSTNISRPEIDAEYYGDISILIDHAGLAQAYRTEFEEMYAGSFHDLKTDNTTHSFSLADGTVIESYFAPSDNGLTNAIVKAVDRATSKIDVRAFYLSSQEMADALVAAKGRGVSIRVIVDAESAAGGYSLHGQLRAAGIPVKVENWGGTEHNKTLVVDGSIVVFGSQNFTLTGNTANDENVLYIDNQTLGAAVGSRFETAWGTIPSQWLTADPDAESADSPGSLTDLLDNDHDDLTDEGGPESLGPQQSGEGAINVYFLRQALTQAASTGNAASYNVDLEQKLVERIASATATIDLATYELNLPGAVDALLARAAAGVQVRMIADGKSETDSDGTIDNSYQIARLHYERLVQGGVVLFADSPIFAVTDPALRAQYGLPATPALPYVTVTVGTTPRTGYLVADAEHKTSTPTYYSPTDQMHNKFAIVDGAWVFTGSWNFTMNDTFGSEENRAAGFRNGNTNHALDIHSAELAAVYRTEFEEMWGGSSAAPAPLVSNFHSRKVANTPTEVFVGGRRVRVFFSEGDDPLPNLTQIVSTEAQVSAHFSTFAWSDQPLVDALKVLYEGSAQDLVGVPTGFVVQGVFEDNFWDQYWSASMDMTGRVVAGKETYSTRWANPAPVFFDGEDGFLHHKYMIVDANTASDPFVVTGSTNWSANGNDVNDENMLVIYDAAIANQFYQEFAARYFMAGGVVGFLKD